MVEDISPRRMKALDFLSLRNVQFVIPDYQRGYVWEAKKQIDTLLLDFLAILKDESQGHFIGIFIYLANSVSSFSENQFHIIDGQQRLTSLFLILFALRQICEDNGDTKNANIFTNNYFTNNEARADDMRLKLKLLRGNNDVYLKIANHEFQQINEEDKETNLYKAYSYILNFFKSLVSEYSIDQIRDAMNKLSLVTIPLAQSDDPHQIFESINAKGSPLTAIDLVRNFVLTHLDDQERDKLIKSHWQKIEEKFPSKDLQDFLRFFLMNQSKNFVNKKNVYKAFCDYYFRQIEQFDNKNILEQILSYAQYYHEIYFEDLNLITGELKNVLIEFRMIDSTMLAPFVIEIYKLYKEQKLSRIMTINCFNLLIIYLFRRSIIGLDTSAITRLFTRITNIIEPYYDGIDYDDIYQKLIERLIVKNLNTEQRMPNDVEIRDILKVKEVYGLKDSLKTLFTKIENHNNSAPVDTSKLQIEHILPQNGDKWVKSLNISEQEHQKQVNRIGNLTFASKSDNITMSNNLFEYKTKILKNTSHLKINQSIINLERWGVEEIEKRTDEIIDEIISLYPYPQISSIIENANSTRFSKSNRKTNSSINYNSINQTSSKRIIRSEKTLSEKYAEVSDEIRNLYDTVKDYILQLGTNISELKLKVYTAFKKTTNIICLEIRDTTIKCTFRLNPKDYSKIEGVRDVTNIGHWGTGDLQIILNNLSDLEKFKFIFDDAYHNNS